MFKLYLIPVLKSSPSTETVISNKEVAVKSTSKPHRKIVMHLKMLHKDLAESHRHFK